VRRLDAAFRGARRRLHLVAGRPEAGLTAPGYNRGCVDAAKKALAGQHTPKGVFHPALWHPIGQDGNAAILAAIAAQAACSCGS
jgi:hypothetical protein